MDQTESHSGQKNEKKMESIEMEKQKKKNVEEGKKKAKERKASRKFNAQFVPHCCFRCQ